MNESQNWWNWAEEAATGVYTEAEGHGPVQKSGPIRVIWTDTLIWTDPLISYLVINYAQKESIRSSLLAGKVENKIATRKIRPHPPSTHDPPNSH